MDVGPNIFSVTVSYRVDKPVQFIVFDNGKAGIMGEHSVMDGTPTVRLCQAVLDDIHTNPSQYGSFYSQESAEEPFKSQQPVPLDWEIDQTTQEAIASARKRAMELVGTQEVGFLRTGYGKHLIKKMKVSPDSWAQMIVQLAYARLAASGTLPSSPENGLGQPGLDGYPKLPGGTYEAAMTRRFFKGRTETIRIVTPETRMWVQSMLDADAQEEKGKTTKKEQLELFAEACKRHIAEALKAGSADGLDRHILGAYH